MLQRLTVVLTAILALNPTVAQSESGNAAAAAPLRIAVAANFRPTLESIAQNFSQQTGIDTTISSASTGVLVTQLRRGAPFDVLLGADRNRPDALAKDGFSLNGSYCYARGSLVLLGASDAQLALGNRSLKVAIANPRFAPYGAAALQVITRIRGNLPEPNSLVLGTNVLQTLQFYQHGAADLALISRSLISDSLNSHAFEVIPEKWHDPILQYAIINRSSKQAENARRFMDHLLSDEVLPLLRNNGYGRCS